MRLFESKKISRLTRLSESLAFPRMNEKEYLRKHFFVYPEIQIKAILKQLANETGLDCGFENVGLFEILTNDNE